MAACLAALFEVALMIILCAPEGLRGLDLCNDRLRFEAALSGKLLNLRAGLRLLLGRMVEDGRAVLRAPVWALAVEGGGIVKGKEGIEQLLEAHLGGVEVHLDHLGMTGLVGADILVAGPLQRSALIAYGRRRYAGNGRKNRLDSPETSGSKGCFFLTHVRRDAFRGLLEATLCLCDELFRTSITPKTQKTKTQQNRKQDLFHDFPFSSVSSQWPAIAIRFTIFITA